MPGRRAFLSGGEFSLKSPGFREKCLPGEKFPAAGPIFGFKPARPTAQGRLRTIQK